MLESFLVDGRQDLGDPRRPGLRPEHHRRLHGLGGDGAGAAGAGRRGARAPQSPRLAPLGEHGGGRRQAPGMPRPRSAAPPVSREWDSLLAPHPPERLSSHGPPPPLTLPFPFFLPTYSNFSLFPLLFSPPPDLYERYRGLGYRLSLVGGSPMPSPIERLATARRKARPRHARARDGSYQYPSPSGARTTPSSRSSRKPAKLALSIQRTTATRSWSGSMKITLLPAPRAA